MTTFERARMLAELRFNTTTILRRYRVRRLVAPVVVPEWLQRSLASDRTGALYS